MKKTNRTFKRFAAITSASLLAACAVMPAVSSAADITISGSASSPYEADQATHTYEAYQIFSGTLSGTTLSDIEWGTGISVNATTKVPERTYTPDGGDPVTVNIYNELMALDFGTTTNPFQKDNADKSAKIALESAEEVANALTGLDGNSKIVKEFANTVAKYLSSNEADKETSENNVISGLENGYYLVQDSADSIKDTIDSAKTRYILKVAGEDIEVQTKSSYPEVMKKVQEESYSSNDTVATWGTSTNYGLGVGYNDVADYDIGDNVPFKLYGTLPSGIADYDKYYYCFRDTLGTQFDRPDNITILINSTKPTTLCYKWNDTDKKYDQYTDLTATGTKVATADTNCNITFANGAFAVAFGDILAYEGVSASTNVTVSYTARLNETANVGYDGQVNGVYLEYSNNPNEEYGGNYNGTTEDSADKPETGKTKDDGVLVLTYGFDINKVIKDTTTKLADAYFAVYYETSEVVGEETVITKHYIRTNNDNTFKDTTTDKPVLVINEDKTDNASNATGIWKSDTTGNITILGLDKGKTYYVEELKAPDTYNALKDPVAVEITSSKTGATTIYQQGWTYTLDANKNKTAVDNIQVNNTNVDDNATGADIGTIKIENSQGSTLPGTGGIGTTIFYLGGGAMAAIGGVYLISKRRMKKSEE